MEEAIRLLGFLGANWHGLYLEALDMAISALREQEERSNGCEYCNDPHPARTCIVGNMEQVLVGTSFSDAQVWTRELKFCPMCGRRLEEV